MRQTGRSQSGSGVVFGYYKGEAETRRGGGATSSLFKEKGQSHLGGRDERQQETVGQQNDARCQLVIVVEQGRKRFIRCP